MAYRTLQSRNVKFKEEYAEFTAEKKTLKELINNKTLPSIKKDIREN
jgi:hypothetical protein